MYSAEPADISTLDAGRYDDTGINLRSKTVMARSSPSWRTGCRSGPGVAATVIAVHANTCRSRPIRASSPRKRSSSRFRRACLRPAAEIAGAAGRDRDGLRTMCRWAGTRRSLSLSTVRCFEGLRCPMPIFSIRSRPRRSRSISSCTHSGGRSPSPISPGISRAIWSGRARPE